MSIKEQRKKVGKEEGGREGRRKGTLSLKLKTFQ